MHAFTYCLRLYRCHTCHQDRLRPCLLGLGYERIYSYRKRLQRGHDRYHADQCCCVWDSYPSHS